MKDLQDLVKQYVGENADNVYNTLKHSYAHHADRLKEQPIQHIDEALDHIQRFNDYVVNHLKTYYEVKK